MRELEYALLYRLVTSDRPPAEMRHFVIKRGRVCFTVEREFDVALTVMGDDKSMPFRVLDLNILVKHRRVGDGRALVHPQQIAYLKQLVQSRIMDCEKPLDEVSWCQLHFSAVICELHSRQVSSDLPTCGTTFEARLFLTAVHFVHTAAYKIILALRRKNLRF